MKESRKQSFMVNVAIILFSQIAVKLLGLVYRMVIMNVPGFGNSGNGYYNAGFQVYTLLLAISSVGIPNAISKMTSERNALGDYQGAHRIFRTSMLLFLGIGLLCSALLFFGADFIVSNVLSMEQADGAKYVLMALSPSILFVCLSAVIRGYFVGMSDMKATSTSQVLEQVFKCILTIAIVWGMAQLTFYRDDDMKAYYLATGANVATTLATVLSFIYLLFFYRKNKQKIKTNLEKSSGETITIPFAKLCRTILMISVPISLGGIIAAVNRIVDTATITRGIQLAFSEMIPAYGNMPAVMNPTMEQLTKEAIRLSGELGKSDTLLNLPIAMNIAFATVLVPSIAGALAVGDKKEARGKISYSFLISILIIFPCAVGYITLAKPIYQLIYFNTPSGSDLLQISAIALIFIALNQTISGSLQGIGKIYAPATGLLMGCIAKVILNMILIRQPGINIYGAPISSIACQVISFSYGFTVLYKNTGVRLNLKKYIGKPLLSAGIMGLSAWGSYRLIMLLVPVNLIGVIGAIGVAVVVYFSLVFGMQIMSAEEVILLPSGVRILKILKKIGFYRNQTVDKS